MNIRQEITRNPAKLAAIGDDKAGSRLLNASAANPVETKYYLAQSALFRNYFMKDISVLELIRRS